MILPMPDSHSGVAILMGEVDGRFVVDTLSLGYRGYHPRQNSPYPFPVTPASCRLATREPIP